MTEKCLGVQEVEKEVQSLTGTQFPFPGGRQQVGLDGVQYRKAARQILSNEYIVYEEIPLVFFIN